MDSSRVLLDTHAVLWANLAPHKLSPKAAEIIANPATQVFVSAASAWEIATKVRIGKLPGAAIFEAEFMQITARTGYILLPISPELALQGGRLKGKHRDPFDRMIAAHALALNVPLISIDGKLDDFGVSRIW